MKHYYITISLILFSCFSFSQMAEMDVNSIRAKLIPNGLFFSDTTNGLKAGFEALKDSGTTTIFSSSLWLGGKRTSDSVLCSSMARYANQPDNSYSTGPLGGLNFTNAQEPYGAATISSQQIQLWNKVFTITKQEIEIFKAYFECSIDPQCDANLLYPNYQIPQPIIDWPAHGDVSLGQSLYLAPFFDRDQNGYYEPQQGDFPCIKGDKYAWFVMNDKGTYDSLRNFLNIEVQVEVYAYDKDLSNPIDRTVFVGYKIINRGTTSYYDFYAGIFADFDIGCAQDDYVGSLPNLNSFFAYNGDAIDDNCSSGTIPYGLVPPAQGITVLNQDLTSVVSFSNNLGTTNGYEIAYNNMRGKNGNGTPILHYTGDTVTFQLNENSYNGLPSWTEREPNGPGSIPSIAADRKSTGSVGPYNLNPGEVIQIDLAYVYSRANTGDNLASVNKLQQEIPLVQSFYDDSISACSSSLDGNVSVNDILINNISIYPNPFSQNINVELRGNKIIKSIELLNSLGQTVINKKVYSFEEAINTESLPNGVYLLKVTSSLGETGIRKVIKQ